MACNNNIHCVLKRVSADINYLILKNCSLDTQISDISDSMDSGEDTLSAISLSTQSVLDTSTQILASSTSGTGGFVDEIEQMIDDLESQIEVYYDDITAELSTIYTAVKAIKTVENQILEQIKDLSEKIT